MCGSRKYWYAHHGGNRKFQRGRGIKDAGILASNSLHGWGMDIFWNYPTEKKMWSFSVFYMESIVCVTASFNFGCECDSPLNFTDRTMVIFSGTVRISSWDVPGLKVNISIYFKNNLAKSLPQCLRLQRQASRYDSCLLPSVDAGLRFVFAQLGWPRESCLQDADDISHLSSGSSTWHLSSDNIWQLLWCLVISCPWIFAAR